MGQKRWKYIDALRVCSFILIILYHYIIELEAIGCFSFLKTGIVYENANIHMAKVGVTLFFMISGFGLMYSNRDFSIKEYIKKRFVRIYIPFYVVSVLVFLCRKILVSEPVFAGTIPGWHIIFTLLGLDGYLKEYGIATFSLGVGEWFVGCMILMYGCFPLLRFAMKKNAHITLAVSTVFYLIVVWLYEGSVPSHYFFPIKLYDFILGMYLAQNLKKPFQKYRLGLVLAAAFFLFCPVRVPIDANYSNTIFCLILFLCAFHIEETKISEVVFGGIMVRRLSAYSYEVFLVHHWGIIMMNKILRPQSLGKAVMCFCAEFAAIFVVGGILHEMLEKIEKLAFRKSMS